MSDAHADADCERCERAMHLLAPSRDPQELADVMRANLVLARAIAWKLYRAEAEGTQKKVDLYSNWLRISAAVWGA